MIISEWLMMRRRRRWGSLWGEWCGSSRGGRRGLNTKTPATAGKLRHEGQLFLLCKSAGELAGRMQPPRRGDAEKYRRRLRRWTQISADQVSRPENTGHSVLFPLAGGTTLSLYPGRRLHLTGTLPL